LRLLGLLELKFTHAHTTYVVGMDELVEHGLGLEDLMALASERVPALLDRKGQVRQPPSPIVTTVDMAGHGVVTFTLAFNLSL